MSKYLYCLIETHKDIGYLSHGVDGDSPVYTVRFRDIAAVTSDIEKDVIKATAEDCLLHEKVLEEVMKDSTVLPFEFGTVAPDKEAVLGLLKDNYSRIKKVIRDLKNKLEVNVRAVWTNMGKIFQEIVSENRDIALYKEMIAKKSLNETYEDRIKIGQLVAQALYVKKEREMDSIVSELKRESVGYVPGRVVGDNMIMSGAFLVKKANMARFESVLFKLGDKLNSRVDFRYMGPLPPYDFTDLKLTVSKKSGA